MRDTFVKRLSEHAARDPRIMLITGDLGFAVLTDYWQRFPKQFLNAGVAEQNMTGMAAGMALEGMITFTYSIANFTTLRCLEQIRNDAAYHDANVKVVSVGGGFSYGAMGVSHHATEDLAIMRSLPSVTVVAPGDLWETAEATSALIAHPGTCYLRLDKTMTTNTARPGETVRLTYGDENYMVRVHVEWPTDLPNNLKADLQASVSTSFPTPPPSFQEHREEWQKWRNRPEIQAAMLEVKNFEMDKDEEGWTALEVPPGEYDITVSAILNSQENPGFVLTGRGKLHVPATPSSGTIDAGTIALRKVPVPAENQRVVKISK